MIQKKKVNEAELPTSTEGLNRLEILVLTALADETSEPESHMYMHSLKHNVERSGVSSIGFGTALRELIDREFVELGKIVHPNYEEPISNNAVRITPVGWDWIKKNKSIFNLEIIDEIPW